jgi:hypothetical protein
MKTPKASGSSSRIGSIGRSVSARQTERGGDPDQAVQAEEQRIGDKGVSGQPDQAGEHQIDRGVRLDARVPLVERRRRLLQRAAPAEARDQVGLRQMHRPILGRHQLDQPERAVEQHGQRCEQQHPGHDARHVSRSLIRCCDGHVSGPARDG